MPRARAAPPPAARVAPPPARFPRALRAAAQPARTIHVHVAAQPDLAAAPARPAALARKPSVPLFFLQGNIFNFRLPRRGRACEVLSPQAAITHT